MKSWDYYIGSILRKLFYEESKFWQIVKSPTLRYITFRDHLDTMIYALSISCNHLFFIQIGSNDATQGDPLYPFLKNRHWRGIMIEPVHYVFERLAAKYGGLKRFILENVAIAEVNGNKNFYYLEKSIENLPFWYDQLGSFSRLTIMKHNDLIADLDKRIKVDLVECITFETLCSRNAVQAIDLIHIDTEGFDYEILKLIDFQKYQPHLLIYEHKHLSITDKCLAYDLLIEKGYTVLEVSSIDTVAASLDALINKPLIRKAWDILLRSKAKGLKC